MATSSSSKAQSLKRFRYRVEVNVEADEALSAEQLRDAFTADTWGLVLGVDSPIGTELVLAWPRRGTKFA